ncbi:GNAT family N-acetyltransferase [Ancylobacter sp. Lp-2]|uniref:GNAT family N-acetyltransferase n=1 Tax=Ancylobacter sp. Lp-2 TaxID=2881339 RepID=UPI001E53CAD7|nr:GNAT family N-acetyltransferase [Ancylobacter sp. Lp-2]MCB4771705.1 GNAT family N-acetyltransferase [Ancylobacter sp. Lp-2]
MTDTRESQKTAEAPAPRGDAVAEGVIRKIVPAERQMFLDHLLRLDPLSRFMRFGGVVSDAALTRHAARAVEGDKLLVGFFHEGELRAVAELHPLPKKPGKPVAAEAAFSVERDWQGKGVGSALMRQLVLLAQNRGIEDLEVVFLPQNGRMKSIALRHEADFSLDETEMVGHLRTPPATPISWLREMIGDVSAVFSAAFELQDRMLPRPHRGH